MNLFPAEWTPNIVFEKMNGRAACFPYSRLMLVEFDGKEELKLQFFSGRITIHGENLRLLRDAICARQVERISETESSVGSDSIWVRALIFTQSGSAERSGEASESSSMGASS